MIGGVRTTPTTRERDDPGPDAGAGAGFDHVGPHGSRLRLADLSPERLEGLRAVLAGVGRDAVGLNPDLDNLLRLLRPVERWEPTMEKVAPHMSCWHVENDLRSQDESTGSVVTAPVPPGTGVER